MIETVHPILGSQDIHQSIDFYVNKLGFELAFQDSANDPNYVGYRRGGVLLHMQFQYEHEMSRTRLRFNVGDVVNIYDEYASRDVAISDSGIRNTDWGTREFSLWDPDRNALTFFQMIAASSSS